jgi:hypothetical protein
MTITISNNAPVALDTTQFDPPLESALDGGSDYNLHEIISGICTNHLVKSSHKGLKVTATDDDGNDLAVSDVASIIVDAFNPENSDIDTEDDATAILSQLTGMVDPTHNLHPRQAFFSQSLTRLRQPAPSKRVIYSAYRDVIQSAKDYLSYTRSNKIDSANTELERFYASVAATYNPATLGVVFANNDAFDRFKEHFNTVSQNIIANHNVDAAEATKMRKFNNLSLEDNLTESLILRKSQDDATQSYSFARVLLYALHEFIMDDARDQAYNHLPQAASWMVFDMAQWLIPETLVFANLHTHATASPKDVDEEWEAINNAIAGGLRIVSPKSITKLTTAHNQLQKAANMAVKASKNNKDKDSTRDINESVLSQDPPSAEFIVKDVLAALKHCSNTNKSQNMQQFVTKSIHKQSRRQPDNPNVPGRVKAKHYYPDVHIYADTSGSISIEEYQTTTYFIMQLAQKLGFNIYFSSFSHLLSHEVMLPVKGKTPQQLAKMIEVIPKVTGMTDFYQVWDYIAASDTRMHRFNLMITDFEFTPDPYRKLVTSPYMFYAPTLSQSNFDWSYTKRSIANFTNHMDRHDPLIVNRLLGVGLRS